MDRRADPRVEVRLRCHLDIPGSKLSLFVGMTINMSRSGLLVAWNADGNGNGTPKAGDLLSVDIELPANHNFGRRSMHCQTTVSRVTADERGAPMVALLVNQMQFRSYDARSHSVEAGPDEVRMTVM